MGLWRSLLHLSERRTSVMVPYDMTLKAFIHFPPCHILIGENIRKIIITRGNCGDGVILRVFRVVSGVFMECCGKVGGGLWIFQGFVIIFFVFFYEFWRYCCNEGCLLVILLLFRILLFNVMSLMVKTAGWKSPLRVIMSKYKSYNNTKGIKINFLPFSNRKLTE